MKNEDMATALDVLEELDGIVREFVEGEVCDHDVGICYCSVFQTLEDSRKVLIELRGKDPLAKGDPPPYDAATATGMYDRDDG